ncbi:MAG: menaquinone biosynthesis decarboxylase [Bacteroidota bacterium]
MAYSGLSSFIDDLERNNELTRIKTFVDPVLEITEITDRILKNNGKALLFENTGTKFPLLINAYGSDKRLSMALGRDTLDDTPDEITELFGTLTATGGRSLKALRSLLKISGYMPKRIRGRVSCQQVVDMDPDTGILPVLKCWPHDGGRFITLPMVHTKHPETGKTNVGMYRMQILDRKSTAMHWQLHKTGANHFEAWKKAGLRMPVSVTLGGDPVYAYASTAPLPENFDEYILAGFLRKKKVKLVKCITNDLYVPSDADIVIEGYVDPAEELVWEGPFGDHTGFYSLAGWYPRFHINCITYSGNAVYPATVVGVPPHEDAWLIKAAEKIFLAPVRLAVQPEIEDFHMPAAGVAHNLVLVKIRKTYQGQGKKVISSLFGTGQMMFTKYLVVVSGRVDIRNYSELIRHVLANTDFRADLVFTSGPLDVLDHSSDTFAMGGKLGIDGTIKMPEEKRPDIDCGRITRDDLPVTVVGVNQDESADSAEKSREGFRNRETIDRFRIILAVDHTVDMNDMHMVAWQVLGNSDPQRDIEIISGKTLYVDGTIKAYHGGRFPRKWPNVVCSDEKTIKRIDQIWESLVCGPFIPSPSMKTSGLLRGGTDEIITGES